jgi:hypothetical protein
MTFENYIKGKLVAFAVESGYHYGDSESMFAVAQVLKNRVDAGWCGGDWLAVINSAPDFIGTEVCQNKLFDHRDLTFRKVLSQIDDIYHGSADDSNVNITDDTGTHRALYYAELHNINRRWFTDNILNDLKSHRRLTQVGQLTFFA